MSDFSAEQKRQCVERELRFRRVVFGKRVERQAMSQQQADYEIGCMEAIAKDYEAIIRSGGNWDGRE